MKRLLLLLFSALALQAQTCTLDSITLTGTNRTVYVNSNNTCNAWVLTYQSTGFSALSIEVDTSNNNSSWTVASANVLVGSNPSTALYGMIQLYAYGPYVSVDLSSVTGSGTVTWQLKGSNGVLALANSSGGGSGGTCGALGGDASGTCAAVSIVNGSHITNASLPNTGLVHASTTVNGQTCTLGGTCTVTAGPTGTAGGDLSGAYPNPNVANLSHVTNASLPNSGLVNDSTTVNGTPCVLGASCTVSGGSGGSGPIAGAPGSLMNNSKYVGVAGAGHVASGDVDLYTVPSGKIGIIVGANAYNDSMSAVDVFWEVKIGGTYYQIVQSHSVMGGALYSGQDVDIILPAGETFSVNVGTGSVINPSAEIWEADATSNLASAIVTSFISGDNTIFTSPTGRSASLLPGFVDVGPVNLYYFNASGGTTLTSWNLVPSGGSVGTNNLLSSGNSITTGTAGNIQADISMNAGDFVSLNTNSTGKQIAWINYALTGTTPSSNTVVQSAENSGGGTPYAIAFPSNVTTGHLLIGSYGRNSNLTNPCNVTDTLSTSFSQAIWEQGTSGFPEQVSISTGVPISSGADTLSGCTSAVATAITEITGPLGAGVDVSGGGSTLAMLTTTQTNDLLITAAYYACVTPTATVTLPEVLLESFADGSGSCLALSFTITGSAGMYTSSLNIGVGTIPAYATIAYKTH